MDGLAPAFPSLPCISNAGKWAETHPKLTSMGNHERQGAAELSQSHPRDWVVFGKPALAGCSEHSQFQTQNSLQLGIGPGLLGWGQVHKSPVPPPAPALLPLLE